MSASKTTAAVKTPVAKAAAKTPAAKAGAEKAPAKKKVAPAKPAAAAEAKAETKTAARAKTAPKPAVKPATKAATKKSAAGKAAAAEAPAEKPAKKAASPRRGNDNALVIVESPAKAKTIKKYLGSGYIVKASVGHVKDLPKKKLGIDIEHGFQPEYVVIETKKKVLAEIKEAAENAKQVFLAPDPDREGEAIAWHIAEEIRPSNPNIHRVLFNEITKKAILEALGKPMELDSKKFESQQARRVLDRLVGYQISPVLWTKVRRGLSAGRVQSVAVRLIC